MDVEFSCKGTRGFNKRGAKNIDRNIKPTICEDNAATVEGTNDFDAPCLQNTQSELRLVV